MSLADGPKILALAGGVGGAKLCRGLALALEPDELQIVVNTGDDFWHLGLAISPDIDSVLYALAGVNDQERGWGRAGESWNFMAGLDRLGAPTWFKLGDLDLATHIWRTHRLLEGATPSAVTRDLARRLGIGHRVAPMSDDIVQTIVDTVDGPLAFQEYFVARQCAPEVEAFRFDGIESAEPAADFLQAFRSLALQAIVICPSNPFVSIDPILNLPGIRALLADRNVPMVAVSPIVSGQAVKGPAAKMLKELKQPVSASTIARHYGDLLDGIVIDTVDASLKAQIERTGCKTMVCNTIMRSDDDRKSLAQSVLSFADSLKPRHRSR